MTPDEYAALQVAFVSGHSGAPLGNVLLTSAVFPLSLWLHRAAAHAVVGAEALADHPAVALVLDLATLVLPTYLSFVLPDARFYVQSALFMITVSMASRITGGGHTPNYRAQQMALDARRKPFISAHRSILMISTCLAILAVDFSVFPRAFAKCETFGISIMDVGVGSFLFANGLVSKPATKAHRAAGYSTVLWRSFVAAVPPLVLGLGRLVFVKSADYQEHVSEYGVHWNFFMTLAVVSLLTSLLSLPARHGMALGFAVILGYEALLHSAGLQEYILGDERVGFVGMNKEGIFSSIGYFALFLSSMDIGARCATPKRYLEWRRFLFTLVRLALVYWILLWVSLAVAGPISRRMVNLSYYLFCMAYNVSLLSLFLALDLVLDPCPTLLVDAINRNQLPIFLVANVCTGVVNMSMRTVLASDAVARAVILVYIGVVCAVAWFLDRRQITLKFW